jgi:thiamine biosynthesis lipoprotein
MCKYPIILVCLMFLLSFCSKPQISRTEEIRTEFVLGTICQVNLYGQGSDLLYSKIFTRLREIENTMSVNMEDTVVDRINQNAGRQAVEVPPDLLDVLERSLVYARLSGGAFDPSIGPLVKLWGIGTDAERRPDGEEIASALSLADYRNVEIDREQRAVFLRKPGMALDLGAIAKGYAADEVAAILEEAGIGAAVIDLGGNVFALGDKSRIDAQARGQALNWRIGVQDPLKERGNYIGVMEVRNKSIVTSGIYERYMEEGGKHYHHILSTQNGYPVDNGLLSVTIAADHSIDADALSTTVFALGYEKGRALLESPELRSIAGQAEAVFVFADLSVRLTSGMAEYFRLSTDEYRLAD